LLLLLLLLLRLSNGKWHIKQSELELVRFQRLAR
jgi:hypothetical protein